MLFEGGFSFSNFVVDVLTLFIFIIWFWLLIVVFGDLFRRHDISGWLKALWVIILVLAPYIGVLVYMISQGRRMTERMLPPAQEARAERRRVAGFSVADEVSKLEALKQTGSISNEEFVRIRARLVE
jgi:Phospholipase_D-nuclease N-terminal